MKPLLPFYVCGQPYSYTVEPTTIIPNLEEIFIIIFSSAKLYLLYCYKFNNYTKFITSSPLPLSRELSLEQNETYRLETSECLYYLLNKK